MKGIFLHFLSWRINWTTNLIHLDLVVWMYAQSFYILKTFPFTATINYGTNKRIRAHMSNRNDNCIIVSYYIFLHPSFVAMGKVHLDNDSNQPKYFNSTNFELSSLLFHFSFDCHKFYLCLHVIVCKFDNNNNLVVKSSLCVKFIE